LVTDRSRSPREPFTRDVADESPMKAQRLLIKTAPAVDHPRGMRFNPAAAATLHNLTASEIDNPPSGLLTR
jgi:hypothetical protein